MKTLLFSALMVVAIAARADILRPGEPAPYSARLDGPLQERMLDMATDQDGNIYIVGSFSSPEMVLEVFGDDPATAEGAAIQVQKRTLRTAGGEDLFVAKYDPAGNLLWARSGGGPGNDYATGVGVDENGNVFVTGSFAGTASVGGSTLSATLQTVPGDGKLTSVGLNVTSDLFVAMLSPGGAWRWAKKLEYALYNQTTTYESHVKIDFTRDLEDSEKPADFELGDGAAFSTRTVATGTMKYGWVSSSNFDSPRTNTAEDDDNEDLDGSFIHTAGLAWRIDVPAGTYRVTAKSGDHDHDDSFYHTVVVTSEAGPRDLIRYNADSGSNNFASGQITVILNNPGYIVLREGSQADNNKLSWVTFERLTTNRIGINVTGTFGIRSGSATHSGRALALGEDGGELFVKGRFVNEQNVSRASGTATGIYFQPKVGEDFLIDDDGSYTGARNAFVARLRIENSVADRNDPAKWQWDWLTPFGTGFNTDLISLSDLAVDSVGDLVVGGVWGGRLTAGGAEVDVTNNTPATFNTEPFVLRLRRSDGQRTMLATVRTGASSDQRRQGSVEALETDVDGNIYVLGNFNPRLVDGDLQPWTFVSGTSASPIVRSGTAGRDFWAAKLSDAGEWLWVAQPSGSGNRWATAFARDPAGTLYITGGMGGAVSFGNTALAPTASQGAAPFIAKLREDDTGQPKWTAAVTEASQTLAPLNHHHGAVLTATSAGTLWWLVSSGKDSALDRDLAGGGADAAAEQGNLYGLGTRMGGSAVFDQTRFYGGLLLAADLNLTSGGGSFNTTGIPAGSEIVPPAGIGLDSSGRPFQPEIEINGQVTAETAQYFYWDSFAKKLFAVSPISGVRIRWRTSATLTDPSRLVVPVAVRWPDEADGADAPQLHIIGGGLSGTEPAVDLGYGPGRTHTFATVLFTSAGANVNNGLLTVAAEGFTTLLYVQGPTPAAGSAPARLLVAKHQRFQSLLGTSQPAEIGTALSDGEHEDPVKNGFVANVRARFDGDGLGAAHRRLDREGPIIPVNTDEPQTAADDMVVLWYRRNLATGTFWPAKAVRYDCQWPAAPDRIVITSSQGSDVAVPIGNGLVWPQEQLTSAKFQNARIYHQPDKAKSGYNPNEEHALIEASQTRDGISIYALRNDLNHLDTNGAEFRTSDPYVLLRYQDGQDGLRPKFKVFRVELTGSYTTGADSITFDFTSYRGTAGTRIHAPFPLSILGDRAETSGTGDPFWLDKNNAVWARSAGELTVAYWYPLRPDFWFDRDSDGVADNVTGVPWLEFITPAQAPSNATAPYGDPIRVAYTIAWPAVTPTLAVGDTLSRARDGLPDLRNWLSAELIFDENEPGIGHADATQRAQADPLRTSARLLDALSPRAVRFASRDSGGQLTNTGGRPLRIEFAPAGKRRLTDLPPHLKPRVLWNPALFNGDGGIEFSGVDPQDPTGAGAVLLNVMSARERSDMLALDDPDGAPTSASQWDQAVDALFHLTRNPNQLDLDGNGQADTELLYGLLGPTQGATVPRIEPILGGAALTAGLGAGTGYMTLAQNNSPGIDSPVALSVLRVVLPPVTGSVHVINADNVFSEKVTLRHSPDFGGEPGVAFFEWYYKEDSGGPAPTSLPSNDSTWVRIAEGVGVNDLTISGSGLRSLSDGWIYVRYRRAGTSQNIYPDTFSQFSGDRSATTTPRPAHYDGWIKRVLSGIAPFEQRVRDFHQAPAQTYVSMIQQAGARYEGDVAFNPSADNVNSVSLIALYETVLRRGLNLSLNGSPAQTTAGVNNSLLLAASRISDLYMLLGNEAYGDAQDPTIGFNTAGSSDSFGTLASSVFSFQNQLPSLIDEELTLLRGRDDSGAGVGARPVYNRLFWNFTNGLEGEPAYVLNYNVSDQNFDGFINEADAATLYPQGHGDAWGHYLTATAGYYKLMRHPLFTWIPRSETVTVAGVPINVDYLDEAKFVRAAAAKARTGREIVELTYRDRYTADPRGQFQGYKDTDENRAWGVDDWARRASQAAFFDWALGNALLPETSTRHGLERVDRHTVTELAEIAEAANSIQATMDKADRGLNPLGLTGDTIPFDINPALVISDFQEPETHFEQVFARAQGAVNNALRVFNFANSATERIRTLQLTANEFADQVDEADRDFKNRLIEIYGYPHAGDIGPGKTYPAGYDGPDIYKWMYVDVAEFSASALPPPSESFTGFFSQVVFSSGSAPGPGGSAVDLVGHYFPSDLSTPEESGGNPFKSVEYPITAVKDRGASQWAFQATPAMGIRRASGRLQQALSRVVGAEAELEKAVGAYTSYLDSIKDEAQLLQAQFDVASDTIKIRNTNRDTQIGLSTTILALDTTASLLRDAAEGSLFFGESVVESIPKNTATGGTSFSLGDALSTVRGTALGISWLTSIVLDGIATTVEAASGGVDIAKEAAELKTEIEVETAGFRFEIQQRLKGLEQLLRDEVDYRIEMFQRKRDLTDAMNEVRGVIAEGERLLQERLIYNQKVAGPIQTLRYQDIAFRNFRNDALGKYRAAFDLAARYVYLAARAYDYETVLPAGEGAGSSFLHSIVRQRALGQFIDGEPINGVNGLSDPMARLKLNFSALKGQLGFNNPQVETGRFSLRTELFRILEDSEGDEAWRDALGRYRVADLWKVAEFRRYCRPFAPESAGPQPGLVIPFNTDITFGLNFFGFPLAGGDSSYDSTNFATKVRSVGVWFENYNGRGLSATPRVYLVPAGLDILRSPDGNDLATREFSVVDQRLPEPFPIGTSDLTNPAHIPQIDGLDGSMVELRRFNRLRAYHDAGFSLDEMTTDSRLVGRSVWNTRWLLIIPGGAFLNNANEGLDTFVHGQKVPGSATQRDGNGVSDIKLFFQTYAYPGR